MFVSFTQVQLPVKSVATSLPFLVLLWAHFANMWGIYFIATNGPKYTLEVLGFNMKSVLFFMILFCDECSDCNITFILSLLKTLLIFYVQGGAITGLPYIARLGAGVLFAAAGDYVRRRNFLSLTWIRKIFMLFCK